MNYLNTNERIVDLCRGEFGERQDYKLFYPYEYIPGTTETTICDVCFEVLEDYSWTNTTFTNLSIFFFIICHYDIAHMPDEPGLRYDMIAHEIVKDFAGQDFMGLGNMRLVYNHAYTATPEFRGRVLQFSLFDISQETFNKHDWTII